MKRRKRWWLLIALGPALLGTGLIAWASFPPSPLPRALEAMQSDSQVEVQTDPWLIFQPKDLNAGVGFIFYPGGRVDPRAYAPASHAISGEGYLVVIVPMPLNLAVFAPDRAADVISRFPQIRAWVIGGHSLGGAMAARFAHQHPGDVGGLALWASYPASGDDLSSQDLEVVSIFGTRDGLSSLEEIEASEELLPSNTTFVPIEGGNHSQFGWYGFQSGDNPAVISHEDQNQLTVDSTLALLRMVEEKAP